jgi:CubicO group peptidase (beta-lactamase class C family)
MKNFFKVLLLLLIVLIQSCEKKKEHAFHSSLEVKVDSIINTVPDFSGEILIADRGKPVYHKAFGFKNFETKEAMDTGSIFELASISKQFTAMIIMMLKEEGKLSYDDPIEKYISDLPYPGITIRNLLNHTSGLPDYQSIMDKHWDKSKVANNYDNIEYLKKYHPDKNFELGSKYEYSNTGYMLLACIAEKASDRDFTQLLRDKIFSLLGMDQTDLRTRTEKSQLPNMALGHIYVPEKQRYIHADSFPEFNYTIWLGDREGPGRISSTASDLLKWDQALYKEKLIKSEPLKEAFTPAKLKNDSLSFYGFGWNLEKDPANGNIVSHSGDNPGYKTYIARYIDANKTLIVLCNNAHPKFEEILIGIKKEIEPKQGQ